MLCTPTPSLVLLIIIPTKWLFHWGYSPFSDIPIWLNGFVFFLGEVNCFATSLEASPCSWGIPPRPLQVLDLSRSSLTALSFADPDFGENPICSLCLGSQKLGEKGTTSRKSMKIGDLKVITYLAGLVALHLILTASQGPSFPGESETCMKLEWRTVPRCNYQTYVLYHLPKLQAPAISRRWFNQWGHRYLSFGNPRVACSSSISQDRLRNGEFFFLSANEFDPFQTNPLIYRYL